MNITFDNEYKNIIQEKRLIKQSMIEFVKNCYLPFIFRMIEHNIHKKGKLLKLKFSVFFEMGYSKWGFLRCNAHLNLSDVNGCRNNQYYVMQLCKEKIVLKYATQYIKDFNNKTFFYLFYF